MSPTYKQIMVVLLGKTLSKVKNYSDANWKHFKRDTTFILLEMDTIFDMLDSNIIITAAAYFIKFSNIYYHASVTTIIITWYIMYLYNTPTYFNKTIITEYNYVCFFPTFPLCFGSFIALFLFIYVFSVRIVTSYI